MTKANWQLKIPLDAVIFDCDGTLTTIEGIDALAQKKGLGEQVSSLTAEAMGKSGMSPTLYKKRLDLVKPTQEQVFSLGMEYFVHRVPEVEEVISVLKRLNKTIYILSAGLTPAVAIFGQLLQIPQTNIFAVNIQFDQNGHFVDFDQSSPLVTGEGKRLIVMQLKTKHEQLAYLGDGLNDCATADLVTRFIGYGGAYYRENIAALCQFYIKILSLTPLLPLLLTADEQKTLEPAEQTLYHQGLDAIQAKQVLLSL